MSYAETRKAMDEAAEKVRVARNENDEAAAQAALQEHHRLALQAQDQLSRETVPVYTREADIPEGVSDPNLAALRDAASHAIVSVRKKIGDLAAERDKQEDRRKRYARMSTLSAETDEKESGEYRQDMEEAADLSEKAQRSITALQHKVTALQSKPHEVFLPLGAVVRFAVRPDTKNALSYPANGTVGVVTGLGRGNEFPIRVSLRNTFQDGYGTYHDPSYDRMPTFMIDREDLELVGYGAYPDGSPCEDFFLRPTHGRTEDRISNREFETIIEADGYFWRLHDFGGNQGIEALQAYEDVAEMTWVTGPLPEFEKDETPCP